jgi:hypothetical protein
MILVTRMMAAILSPETSVITRATRRYNPEDDIFQRKLNLFMNNVVNSSYSPVDLS